MYYLYLLKRIFWAYINITQYLSYKYRIHALFVFIFLLLSILRPMYLMHNRGWDDDYAKYKKKFTWLTIDLYDNIYNISKEYKFYRYKLTKQFICSVIQAESGDFCKNITTCMINVKSYAGAIGLIQVMPYHASVYQNLRTPLINLRLGVKYLYRCLVKAKGNKMEAARMYNAGLKNKRSKFTNWVYVANILQHNISFYENNPNLIKR